MRSIEQGCQQPGCRTGNQSVHQEMQEEDRRLPKVAAFRLGKEESRVTSRGCGQQRCYGHQETLYAVEQHTADQPCGTACSVEEENVRSENQPRAEVRFGQQVIKAAGTLEIKNQQEAR